MTDESVAASSKPRRSRIKKLEVMVAEVRSEGPETTTIVLFTGNDTLDYKPGHFLTIQPQQFPALERFVDYFEDLKGKKEPARAYSLASSPHEKYLAITVKEERYISGRTKYPPLLSPILVWRTEPGTRMVVTGFGGPYTLDDDIESRTDHMVHICAGSGVVPNMSMLKYALATGLKLRHTLICGNKRLNDVIYRQELEGLAAEYPGRLRLVHALSREASVDHLGPHYVGGRVTEELLREQIPDIAGAEFYVCGPGITRWDRLAAKEAGEEPAPRFLESALAALDSMGVERRAIRRESYG